jgi:putative transposase
VIERCYESIKYEHLYLREITDGPALAAEVAAYQHVYNHERPHESIDWALPIDRYTQTPT